MTELQPCLNRGAHLVRSTYTQYSHMAHLDKFDCGATAHAAEGSPDSLQRGFHIAIPSPQGPVIERRYLHIVSWTTASHRLSPGLRKIASVVGPSLKRHIRFLAPETTSRNIDRDPLLQWGTELRGRFIFLRSVLAPLSGNTTARGHAGMVCFTRRLALDRFR